MTGKNNRNNKDIEYAEYEAKIDAKAEGLRKVKQSVISTLRSIGVCVKEQKEENLIAYLDEIINPNRTNEERFPLSYRFDSPIANQVSDGNNILAVDTDHISLYADDSKRKVCVKSFNVKTYPPHWALWQGTDLIGEYLKDIETLLKEEE